jgi:hypothetical protein
MRILAEHLTEQQVALLEGQRQGSFRLLPHASERRQQYGFTLDTIKDTVRAGRVVEFHDDMGPRRLLVRRNSCCVVLDLDDRVVVTTYLCRDGHATLDRSRYVTKIPNARLT